MNPTAIDVSPQPRWTTIADDDDRFDAFVAWQLTREVAEGTALQDSQERDRMRLLTDQEVLDRLVELQHALARTQARLHRYVAEAERRAATEHLTQLPTASWLVLNNTHSPRAARRAVREAVQLVEQPAVLDALQRAEVSPEQAAVIADGLVRLPDELDAGQRETVTNTLLEYAHEFGPVPLRRLTNHAVAVVAPDIVEEADRVAVERAERRQHASRSLSWWTDPDGAIEFAGKLPAIAGQQLITVVTSMATKQRAADSLAGIETTWAQACADGLAAMINRYAAAGEAPRFGHDRPRVIVTVDYRTMLDGLRAAHLLGADEQISAAEARRLACDASVLPMVLGGGSVPLNVGRERRLVTGSLRHALTVRDGGCVFPGCDRQPADCEAHHLTPWWAGGETAISNTVLLCPRHHHLVEPNPQAPPGTRWEVRLNERRLPEVISPTQRDGTRLTRQHHRFRLRALSASG